MRKLTKLMKKWNSMRLMNKLLFSYVLLIVLPLLIFTLWTYRDVSGTLLEQFEYSSELSLHQTGIYLDKVVDDLTISTRQVALHDMIPGILKNDAKSGMNFESYSNYRTVTGLVESLLPMDILHSVQLYVDDDIYYARDVNEWDNGINFLSQDLQEASSYAEMLQTNRREICWSAPYTILGSAKQKDTEDTVVVSASRYIKDNLTYQNMGILVVNLPRTYLDALISRAAILPGSLTLLLDQSGRMIASSDEELLQQYGDFRVQLAKEAQNNKEMILLEGEKMSVHSYRIAGTDWMLVSVLPYEEILRTSVEARNKMLGIMLFIGTLFFLMAYQIAGLITRRIRMLSDRIREVQLDDYAQITTIEGEDEIGELVKSYNYLLGKINTYAESQYALGVELKKSELEALQAQINPHFLYNTLDMIHWISESYGADEISEIVSLLSRFYRLSLSNGMDVVSVGAALQHIDVYIKLQNCRFDDSVQLKLQMDPEVYRYGMLKLLLQPIVENSILHGILEKEDQSGTITIEGQVTVNDAGTQVLRFRITDDGVGMTESEIRKLTDTSEPIKGKKGGYGIHNVINRIKLYYGNEYGLEYQSTPGRGTTVWMEIPCVEFEEERVIL